MRSASTTDPGALPGVPVPHCAGDLEAAIKRLPGGRRAEAALLLALPVGEVPGIHARTDLGSWTWRGVTVPVPAPGAAASAAARLVTLGSRDDDRFAELTGDPAGWVKVLRSGAYLVTFGADVLLDLPLLRLDPSLAGDAAGIVAQVRRGELGLGGDEVLEVAAIAGGWLVTSRPQPS